jgi:anti-anti-sigma factor
MEAVDIHAVHKFGEKIFLGNADALTAACVNYFTDKTSDTIVFDLGNVRLCDSFGLRFLINAQRKAAFSNKRLLLFRPDAKLESMLKLAKLHHIFTVVDKLTQS